MQNNVSNISFKSNIRFISQDQYKKLAAKASVKVAEMKSLDEICEVKNKGATEGIKFCIGGVIKNLDQRKDFIFHWFPTKLYHPSKPRRKKAALVQIEEKLQEISKSSNTKGFLIGGLSKNHDSWHEQVSLLSLRLFNSLKKPFNKDQRNNFSFFFSQNLIDISNYFPESAFVYCKKKDTYFVNAGNRWEYREDGFYDLLDKNRIRDSFDWINIAKGDKVFVGMKSKEPVENEFWQKKKLQKK